MWPGIGEIVNLSVSHVSVRTPMDTAFRLKNIWGISTIEHIKANGTIYSSTAVSLEYNDNEPSPYLCNALILKCSLFESVFVYDQSQILMEINISQSTYSVDVALQNILTSGTNVGTLLRINLESETSSTVRVTNS